MSFERQIFLYYLIDSNGKSYYYDNGTVKTTVIPTWLPQAPGGWIDNTITFARSARYYGINRSFTIPLKFVGDGASIIRSLYYNGKGIEQYLGLIIQKYNDQNDTYELYYRGELDMSKYEDLAAEGVNISIMEGGIVKLLKSYENTVYEIPCDGSIPENKKVLISGIRFKDTFKYQVIESNDGSYDLYSVPVVFLSNDGDNVGITKGDQTDEGVTDDIYYEYMRTSGNYLFKSAYDIQLTIKGTQSITGTNPGGETVFLYFAYSISPISDQRFHIFNGQPITDGQTISTSYEFTFTLPAGKTLFLMRDGDYSGRAKQNDASFTITFNSKYEDTYVWTIPAADVFRKLVEKVGGSKYGADCTLLDDNLNLVLTSGDALRQVDKAVIKTSIADFFDSMNVVLNASLSNQTLPGKKESLFFERKGYVFNSSVIDLDLGEVSEFKISAAADYICSNLKIGYSPQSYDEKAGRLEYNTTAQYKAPISRLQKDLILVSKYRADSYGVEYTRFNAGGGKSTTNNASDNSVFILNVDPSSGIVKRVTYDSISGLDNPETAYNIEQLTPARLVRTHGNWLRSIMHNQPTASLLFQTLDKNRDLSTTIGSSLITENSDVRISTLDSPLFYPIAMSFKTKVPVNFATLQSVAANSHIAFKYNGVQFYGFPIEVSQKPALNESQEWKLLASPINNLSNFINLDVDGLNFLDLMAYGMFVPHLCPVKFVPLDNILPAQYHSKYMDGWWFTEQVQNYISKAVYHQPWQKDDTIELQFQTNGLGPVQVEIINCNNEVIGTAIPVPTVSDPAVVTPNTLYQVSISLASLSEGLYYLVVTAGTGGTQTKWISESLYVKETWEKTVLIKYYNNRNKQSSIFSSGYRPSIRVAAFWSLGDFEADAKFAVYEDQPADIELLNGIPYRIHTLFIEDTPPWLLDKLNRILLLTNTSIDGLEFTRNADSKFEKVSVPGWPMSFYTIKLREKSNRDGAFQNVSGTLDDDITVVYNINTTGFGDGGSVVQVTKID